MKYWMLLAGLFFLPTSVAEQQYDDEGKPCEEAVDLAERGQFHRLHFECAKKPEMVDEQAELAAPQHRPGAEYRARATYASAAEAPSAIADLFGQMQNACPKGWSKDKEWVTAEDEGLTLYYQFTCADL